MDELHESRSHAVAEEETLTALPLWANWKMRPARRSRVMQWPASQDEVRGRFAGQLAQHRVGGLPVQLGRVLTTRSEPEGLKTPPSPRPPRPGKRPGR